MAKPAATTRRAQVRGDSDQQRKRNDDVVRDALFQAKRAGRQFDHELEKPGTEQRRQTDGENGQRRRRGRVAAQVVAESHFHNACGVKGGKSAGNVPIFRAEARPRVDSAALG